MKTYNYGLGSKKLWYNDYPDPSYKLITIDFSYAMERFTVYYPFGQRFKEDIPLKRFEEIYQCHKCHDFYGRLSDWEYEMNPGVRKVNSEFCREFPDEGSYWFIHCHCEGYFCSNCTNRLSTRRHLSNKLILTPEDKDQDFYISFTNAMSMMRRSAKFEYHFNSCLRKKKKQKHFIEWRKQFQKEKHHSLMRHWYWNVCSIHLQNILEREVGRNE